MFTSNVVFVSEETALDLDASIASDLRLCLLSVRVRVRVGGCVGSWIELSRWQTQLPLK